MGGGRPWIFCRLPSPPADSPPPTPTSPQGQWADNAYNGRGTYTYPNNHSYVGEWHNGFREGAGVMRWPDGVSRESKGRASLVRVWGRVCSGMCSGLCLGLNDSVALQLTADSPRSYLSSPSSPCHPHCSPVSPQAVYGERLGVLGVRGG